MTTINRRQFVRASCAALAACAPGRSAIAQSRYDLIIRGARVVDPASRLDAVRDIAVSRGRVAAVVADLRAEAADVIDARGKIVAPGLIDIHTHVTGAPDGPSQVLRDGVTAWIDAGSQGADRIGDSVAVARSSPQPGRVLVNIGRAGILPEGDTMDLSRADVQAARQAIANNRDFVVGVKARLSADVAGTNDYEVLRRAQEVASTFNLPVMIHMGQTVSPLAKLLPLLKRGDIVTHLFAPPPNSIIDDSGRVLQEVLDARRRGVWFDVANGRIGHIRWDVVDKVTKQRFWPDTISTDWNAMSPTNAVGNLPNCMSKLLHYGMPLQQAVACVTLNASKVFPAFSDRGTLKIGAPADLALLELREGTFEFVDNFENTVTGKQKLFPAGTILAGRRVGDR